MDSYQVKECQKIIRELLKTPLGQIFKTIDARSIPGYLNVIQRPMDFDTVERRLKNGEYRSTHEYAKDIKKIFSNCRKFNKDSKYFIGAADLCEKEFLNFTGK